MTQDQAADLQAKWKQQGDPPSLCRHMVQELSLSGLHDESHLLRTYHCLECGEAIVHTLTARHSTDARTHTQEAI